MPFSLKSCLIISTAFLSRAGLSAAIALAETAANPAVRQRDNMFAVFIMVLLSA